MNASLPPIAPPRPSLRQHLYGLRLWGLLSLALLVLVPFSGLGLRTPWARPLARSLARTVFRLAGICAEAHGLHRLPAGPHVLVLNHSSFVDAIALVALLPARPGYGFVTRQQFRSQVLLWPLLNSLGTLVLARPSGSFSANVRMMAERLKAGERLVVFPEGRFCREPGLQAFHSGVFLAAVAAGVPVVPAGLRGTRDVLPLGSWSPRRAAIDFEIGQAMLPAVFHAQAAEMLRKAARLAVLRMSGEADAST